MPVLAGAQAEGRLPGTGRPFPLPAAPTQCHRAFCLPPSPPAPHPANRAQAQVLTSWQNTHPL